jgi:hypothetical protein
VVASHSVLTCKNKMNMKKEKEKEKRKKEKEFASVFSKAMF